MGGTALAALGPGDTRGVRWPATNRITTGCAVNSIRSDLLPQNSPMLAVARRVPAVRIVARALLAKQLPRLWNVAHNTVTWKFDQYPVCKSTTNSQEGTMVRSLRLSTVTFAAMTLAMAVGNHVSAQRLSGLLNRQPTTTQLLARDQVQSELKLNAEQKNQIQEITNQLNSNVRARSRAARVLSHLPRRGATRATAGPYSRRRRATSFAWRAGGRKKSGCSQSPPS